jgi:hypothetical protein
LASRKNGLSRLSHLSTINSIILLKSTHTGHQYVNRRPRAPAMLSVLLFIVPLFSPPPLFVVSVLMSVDTDPLVQFIRAGIKQQRPPVQSVQ